MDGLFGAADSGAFGGRDADNDTNMHEDEDGDVFWDAVETPEPMDEDGCVSVRYDLISIHNLSYLSQNRHGVR